jgi:hypothetical protein
VALGLILAPFLFMTVEGELAPAFMQSTAARPAWHILYRDSFFAALAGLAGGAAWGVLHSLIAPPPGRRRAASVRAMPIALALVGVFLGWQGATSVALATLLLRAAGFLAAAWTPLWRVPSTGCVLGATIVQLTTWRWHEAIPLWPAQDTSLIVLAIVCAAAAIAMASHVRKAPVSEGPDSITKPVQAAGDETA